MLSRIFKSLLRLTKLDKFQFFVTSKWRALGMFNQMLVSFALVISAGLATTTYVFAQQQQDMRNVKCLAMNIYHEARGEPVNGQYAVANVTLNRVNAERYPDDVCRVVYQKAWVSRYRRYVAAFSWTVDGSSDIPRDSRSWRQAMRVAQHVYFENAPSNVRDALYYHADYVKPRWAAQKMRIAKIGHHIFYK